VRFTPESLCDLLRNCCAIWRGFCNYLSVVKSLMIMV